MMRLRSSLALVISTLVLLGGSAWAGTKLRGWVTRIDERAQTIEIDDGAISLRGLVVRGGLLETGAFVKVEKGTLKVKPQRPPADDQVVRFPVKDPRNPGRVEFSHLRHFNALGEKQCATCHSPEMKLVTDSPREPTVTAALDPHRPASVGRFCATCHNGATPPAELTRRQRRDGAAVFTTAGTANTGNCQRCHAPADHGRDFTPIHGKVVEHGRASACAHCHRQDWTAGDRQRQFELLAAERALKANPDDSQAALTVGPNNFCVHCHRMDMKWH
jgi:hypothetical protein